MSPAAPRAWTGGHAPERGRVLLLAACAALAAFSNSLGNGFAFDDVGVIVESPAVTSGGVRAALLAPWWPGEETGGRLWRPLTLASFASEWSLSLGRPFLFHALNVLSHVAVTLLVALLAWGWAGGWSVLAGVLFFAVHPVHVEAVANVVGRAELYAAVAYLAACLLYVRDPGPRGSRRVLRLFAIGLLYALGLMAKEIAVTLPLALALLEAYRRVSPWRAEDPAPRAAGTSTLGRRLVAETPVFVLLAVVLLGYLVLRALVLGGGVGEVPHSAFHDRGAAAPFLTGLSLWPHYVRLMLFPLDLSADYDPAVLLVHGAVTSGVLLGVTTLVVLAIAVVGLFASAPAVSLSIAWFAVTVLPVSHLIVHPALLLAERTLYLPSVGLVWLLAAAVERAGASLAPGARRARVLATLCAPLALALLLGRTVSRNPTWFSSYAVMETLAREHPESVRAQLAMGAGLLRVGAVDEAAEAYDLALLMIPYRFGTLLDAAVVHEARGDLGRSEELLRRAAETYPERAQGHKAWASFLLRRGRAREAQRAAAQGLLLSRWEPELLGLLADSYALAGDLPAALRARQAALASARASGGEAGLNPGLLEELMKPFEGQTELSETDTVESAGS